MKIIRTLRESQKMTQAELASKLGLSASTIGMYEQDRREPSLEVLKDIAVIFGVSVDYLLGKETASRDKKIDEGYAGELVELFKLLPEDDQQAILNLAKHMAKVKE